MAREWSRNGPEWSPGMGDPAGKLPGEMREWQWGKLEKTGRLRAVPAGRNGNGKRLEKVGKD